MKHPTIAALALAAASSVSAQTAVDPSGATPLAGSWTYAPVSGGSEATFADGSARPQLTIRCTRAVRQVTIAKPASGAAPFLLVWTSSMSRSVPASFDPATQRINIQLAAWDALLDAISFSRARVAVSVSGTPQLVVPNGAEITRVIEDCRS